MSCRTVIVVERESLIRETLVDLLSEEGYRVKAANDAAGVRVALADEQHPCLILVDLLSGGMWGSDFLALRREDDVLMEIPVAVMSSVAADKHEAVQVAAGGANDYFKKPFDIERLLESVKQFCPDC